MDGDVVKQAEPLTVVWNGWRRGETRRATNCGLEWMATYAPQKAYMTDLPKPWMS